MNIFKVVDRIVKFLTEVQYQFFLPAVYESVFCLVVVIFKPLPTRRQKFVYIYIFFFK